MARRISPTRFTSSLEVQAEAPLDAREVVDSLTDLTDVASFPYSYEGMQVYVKSEKKVYTLIGSDSTDINNWKEIGGTVDSYTKAETDALVEGGHIELTQAQYDALPYDEKHNGKVYFITDGADGTSGGSGGGSIIKLAEAGVVEFESPIESGEIKYKQLTFGYNLLPSDLWSVNVTLGAPISGVDQQWQEQKDGVRLLPVVATPQGSLRIEVLFEKGFNTVYGGKVPVYYQFYANVKRHYIGQSEHFDGGNMQVGDLYTTARAIYDGYMDYGIVLATTIGNAIARGGHIVVAFTDSEGMFISSIGLLDKTRSIVNNPNDGATYYPVVWSSTNVSLNYIKYVAVHPTEEDKYTIFFTDAVTDNAYQYVDSVDKLIGLMGVDIYDMEVI